MKKSSAPRTGKVNPPTPAEVIQKPIWLGRPNQNDFIFSTTERVQLYSVNGFAMGVMK